MQNHLRQTYGCASVLLPNWLRQTSDAPAPAQVRLLYSGSLGEKTASLHQFFQQCDRQGLSVTVVGSGPRKAWFQSQFPKFLYMPPLSDADYAVVAAAHTHFIAAQDPRLQSVLMPSKLLASIAFNRPVIFVSEPSAVSAWIESNLLGTLWTGGPIILPPPTPPETLKRLRGEHSLPDILKNVNYFE
jgi:hypothetical protein